MGEEAKESKNIVYKTHGEMLFHEKDKASSLFIVQKGGVRLYVKKGSGFVDLAQIKAGEVIGEMGYFSDVAARRNCSASAIGESELVEVPYDAFAKIMESLNPWVNTIIRTLVDRLKDSNDRLRQYENNSTGYGASKGYKFFNLTEVIRILTTLYLVASDRGTEDEDGVVIHLSVLQNFSFDIYNVKPAVYEELLFLLQDLQLVFLKKDEDGLMKNLVIKDIDHMKKLTSFLESERLATEEKAMNVSAKCEMFLEKILEQLNQQGKDEEKLVAQISPIIKQFDEQKISISESDLSDAPEMGLCGDILVDGDGATTAEVQYQKLKKAFPAIQLINAIRKINAEKQEG